MAGFDFNWMQKGGYTAPQTQQSQYNFANYGQGQSPQYNYQVPSIGMDTSTQGQLGGLDNMGNPMATGIPSGPTTLGGDPSAWDNFAGHTRQDGTKVNGWGGMALAGAQAAASGFMALQNYKLGKRQLGENQRQFNMNWGAQANMVNSQMADRQAARIAQSGGTGKYQSVGDYMNKYGIKDVA